MKSIATWIFWIVVAIAGWRWAGPSIRAFEDHVACTYQNASGTCMTEAAYIKMIAHDAATDAITEFIASCSSSYTADDRCAVLKRR